MRRLPHLPPMTKYTDPLENPPMFIANAGGGTGTLDLSPVQLARDFDGWLGGHNYEEGDHVLCVADVNGHATSILKGESCDENVPEGELIYTTVDNWFATILGLS
jgi:hypothetical protein